MVEVDRDEDPKLVLELGIPYEDTQTSAHELPDSRTLQLFAMCRQPAPGESLWPWITMNDAEAALEAGILESLPVGADVLEISGAESCVAAVNEDDARLPISCEATRGGVTWDTSDLPAGTYSIQSYTFQPPQSVWAARPGVVRLIDGDRDDAPPAVALMSPAVSAVASQRPGYRVQGCAAGAPGTTVTLSWARMPESGTTGPAGWREIDVLGVTTDDFEITFSAPPDAVGQAVMLRAVAEDPAGRTWTAYAPEPLVVFAGCGQSDPPGPPPVFDYCGVLEEPPAEPEAEDIDCSETETGATSGEQLGDGDGCGCRLTGDRARWWLITLLAGIRRRRRPCRTVEHGWIPLLDAGEGPLVRRARRG